MKHDKYIYYSTLFILSLYLIFGILLTSTLIQSILNRFGSIKLSQILFLIIGAYLIFRPFKYIKYLIKNKKKSKKLFTKFYKTNNLTIKLTLVTSATLLTIWYSGLYLIFNGVVNIILYLPIFVLSTVEFIVTQFMKRINLNFLTGLIALILPITQILYLFLISKVLAKLFKN